MAHLFGSSDPHHRTDHVQLLSSLFIAWGFVQGAAAWLILSPFGVAPVPYPKTFTLVLSVLTMLFVVTGLLLRHSDAQIRPLAMVLSVLALFAFPVGTALGLYGLWVLTKVWTPQRELRHAPARQRITS